MPSRSTDCIGRRGNHRLDAMQRLSEPKATAPLPRRCESRDGDPDDISAARADQSGDHMVFKSRQARFSGAGSAEDISPRRMA